MIFAERQVGSLSTVPVMHPIRLGLQFWNLDPVKWRDDVRRYEQMGFGAITFADHVIGQWDPFVGEHYQVENASISNESTRRPRLLIGGGGKKMLRMAAAHADIISVMPRLPGGIWDVAVATADSGLAVIAERVQTARNLAEDRGRDSDGMEFNTLVAVTKIDNDGGRAGREAAEAVRFNDRNGQVSFTHPAVSWRR